MCLAGAPLPHQRPPEGICPDVKKTREDLDTV
jgi:hypothetical protein